MVAEVRSRNEIECVLTEPHFCHWMQIAFDFGSAAAGAVAEKSTVVVDCVVLLSQLIPDADGIAHYFCLLNECVVALNGFHRLRERNGFVDTPPLPSVIVGVAKTAVADVVSAFFLISDMRS